MTEDVRNKVNIDVYFSDFETPEVVISEVIPADKENKVKPKALPQVDFARPSRRKEPSQEELSEAAHELKQLRWQIDELPGHLAKRRVMRKESAQTLRLLLAGICVSIVASGSFLALRQCQKGQICEQWGQLTDSLHVSVVSQLTSFRQSLNAHKDLLSDFTMLRFRKPELLEESNQLQTPAQSQDVFQRGVDEAETAMALQQEAIAPDEWQKVVRHWEMAIAHLAEASSDDQLAAEAREKSAVYQLNLEYARSEVDSFREAVNAAMAAAVLTQSASTEADWQQVAQTWLEAISLMDSVTPESEHYQMAQRKILEYSSNLLYAQTEVLMAARAKDQLLSVHGIATE
ncbi:hypothetical protein [Halomicronema sp. CCY15110]|uniref:hypothetical protein n=1 Tax=Halomicronema sp. CCY15110 TaxID=2767773 RepID=UPI00194E5437|nr:hypothetical protein [Halomicronema sp. CCY15110]